MVHGFDDLEHMRLINFTWYDTGNNESYLEVRKYFQMISLQIKVMRQYS